MIAIKGMAPQTDCQKCPFMATDGTDTLSPMMCMALWATKHEVKHCIQGKILNDCPLVEVVNCKDCKHNPELTASEKKFLADIVNAYTGLVNIQTVEKMPDISRDCYYLRFKTDVDSSNTFSCFRGMFTELEEHKDYNIRKLLGKDC